MITREVSSLQHPIVKYLVKLREDRKFRIENGSVLISGIKLVHELSPLCPLKTLVIAPGYTPQHPLIAEQTLIGSEQLLKKVTGLQEPEPIAAEIALPRPSALKGVHTLLILDRISDPGNLGTLFRTALALGWQGVFLTPGTSDPFNEKALRAAKGATFKMPYREGSYEELGQLLKENQMKLLVADAQGASADTLELPSAYALVLGNESHGVSPCLKNEGCTVCIPIDPRMESLNVSAAGAILMHLFKPGRLLKRGSDVKGR